MHDLALNESYSFKVNNINILIMQLKFIDAISFTFSHNKNFEKFLAFTVIKIQNYAITLFRIGKIDLGFIR